MPCLKYIISPMKSACREMGAFFKNKLDEVIIM
nr:MAG TPA: translation initiation factor-like protein [Caudoviricetes sp.]